MGLYNKVILILLAVLVFSGCRTTEEMHSNYYQSRAERITGGMTDTQLVGQMFMLSLKRDLKGETVESGFIEMGPEVEALISEINPGGILLYGENLSTVEGTITFINGMQSASSLPLWIAMDEEGGRVSRLDAAEGIPNTSFISNLEISELGDTGLAKEKGRVIGRELAGLGVNMNLAPIADIYSNPENRKIGDRAYGSDPLLAGEMVASETRGLQNENVAAVLKHFPGYGDAVRRDGIVTVNHDREQLRTTELRPFSAGIEAGAAGIMVGHISVPAVTGNNTPATFSSLMLQDILRDELGFDGVVISDSMATEGIAIDADGQTTIVEAVKAGIDMILFPSNPLGDRDAVLTALSSGELSRERIEASVIRIIMAKQRMGLWDTEIYHEVYRPEECIGSEEHRSAVQPILASALEE